MTNPLPPADADRPSDPGQDADAATQALQAQLDALLAGIESPQVEDQPTQAQPATPPPASPPPRPSDEFEQIAAALEAAEQPVDVTSPPQPPQAPAPQAPQAPQESTADPAASSEPEPPAYAAQEVPADAAFQAPQPPPPSPAEAAALGAIDQQIDALLQSMDPDQAPPAEPAPPAVAEAQAAAPPEPTIEPTPMQPPPAEATPSAPAAPTPANAPVQAAEPDAVKSLEDEIAALFAEQPVDAELESVAAQFSERDQQQAEIEKQMFARPQAQPKAEAPAETAEAAEEPSTEDLIAAEIEGLLNSEADAPDVVDPSETGEDPSIAEIDQLLASQAEQEEELVGDFQSVDDVAAGIVPQGPGQKLSEVVPSEGSADTIAAELDSQPENQPDTFKPKPAAERADEPQKHAAAGHLRDRLVAIPWRAIGRQIEWVALWVCGLINWPVRRLLAPEWRSYVGYIAVLNVFVGLALFALGVARQVF